jgi:uncharacterized protein YdaU (DUF1376 family)
MADQDSTAGKAPAFQFYPKDFLSDSNVVGMSMQERGVYITLLCICWQDGSISADPAQLARKCATPLRAFQKLWPAVEKCFRKVAAGRMVHPRLDRERQKQVDYRQRQSDASRKRWDKPGPSHRIPKSGTAPVIPAASSALSDLRSSSSSADSSQIPAAVDARSKRPIFKGQRFVVHEWQLDDLRRMLGSHTDAFDLHAWFFDLDARVASAEIVVPQRDGGRWLQDEALAEASRRGIPIAASTAAPFGKTAGNQAAAARFVARGQR